ncbi:MAG: hypothetical protein LBK53_04470 [Heliobacteriaceae bacterium]|nr:hypothetical protein [Heliobacteriaceae bacterium]
MKEVIIEEDRLNIFTGIFALLAIGLIINALLFSLLSSKDDFYAPQTSVFAYYFIITLFSIASIPVAGGIIKLIFKFIKPYKLILSDKGFYDNELKQLIFWDNIELIKSENLNKITKKAAIFYAITAPLKYFLYSRVASYSGRIFTIQTKYKNELLKKAGVLKKMESSFFPKNMIRLGVDEDLLKKGVDVAGLINRY